VSSSRPPSSGSRPEGDENQAVAFAEGIDHASRPGTAPAGSNRHWGAKPPPLPHGGGGYPSLAAIPLAGQKLRSSRANRIDDLLTSSREPSPPAEMGEATATNAGTQQQMQVLAVHAEALRRRLETQQVERENLRFQVQLLQNDAREHQPEHFEKMIACLEVENRSRRAVDDEKVALERQLHEVDQLLADLEHKAPEEAPEEDEDDLEELRWESQRLERRLEEAKRYNRELMEEAVQSAKLATAKGTPLAVAAELADLSEDPEIDQLLSRNEETLRRLTGEVRDTATAMARQSASRSPPPGHDSSTVNVLTIGVGADGADVEWHKHRSKGSKK